MVSFFIDVVGHAERTAGKVLETLVPGILSLAQVSALKKCFKVGTSFGANVVKHNLPQAAS